MGRQIVSGIGFSATQIFSVKRRTSNAGASLSVYSKNCKSPFAALYGGDEQSNGLSVAYGGDEQSNGLTNSRWILTSALRTQSLIISPTEKLSVYSTPFAPSGIRSSRSPKSVARPNLALKTVAKNTKIPTF